MGNPGDQKAQGGQALALVDLAFQGPGLGHVCNFQDRRANFVGLIPRSVDHYLFGARWIEQPFSFERVTGVFGDKARDLAFRAGAIAGHEHGVARLTVDQRFIDAVVADGGVVDHFDPGFPVQQNQRVGDAVKDGLQKIPVFTQAAFGRFALLDVADERLEKEKIERRGGHHDQECRVGDGLGECRQGRKKGQDQHHQGFPDKDGDGDRAQDPQGAVGCHECFQMRRYPAFGVGCVHISSTMNIQCAGAITAWQWVAEEGS
ncbi:hypothetical protein DESC_600070 [Desulfosarcina cetonica]|nr:hypothetical protein DESC_600070 [Desulfosarcina cetonica]